MKLAVTGATGFVGKRLIERALAEGHSIRALTRRPQPERAGVAWIAGDLADPGTLCEGADAVIHVAGVVNALDRAGFGLGNIAGTESILAAAEAAKVARFVHVSSYAAREPQLSAYGWSKAGAETAVIASDRAWTIVRPPGIYGPGDLELRDMFRIAKLGLAVLPPAGQSSWMHVDDLAALLLVCAIHDVGRIVIEADDGMPVTHVEFGRAIGRAVGRRVLPVSLPGPLLSFAARTDGWLRGKGAKLTPDRVGYLIHPDWTANPALRADPALWQPVMPLDKGLADTVAWYRANRLL